MEVVDKKCIMTSFISSGDSLISDSEAGILGELKWLREQTGFEIMSALVYRNTVDKRGGISEKYCTQTKYVEYITDENKLVSQLAKNEKRSERIYLTCLSQNANDKSPYPKPPYSYHEESNDKCYSMTLDGELEPFPDLPGYEDFAKWLYICKPGLIFNRNGDTNEILFLLFIKCIQDCQGDVPKGLSLALERLGSSRSGHDFSLLFSDGSGVYAYSAQSPAIMKAESILYKFIRNTAGEFNYILTNSRAPEDINWIKIKTDSLYYFPSRGEQQTICF